MRTPPVATLRDVRSLGASAPLRAGYELSKHAGGHAVVFGALARLAGSGMAPPFRRRSPPAPIAPPAVQRVLAAAEAVLVGRAVLFGRDVEIGRSPDWWAVLDGPGAWPNRAWWQIDIRSEARAGDVKWAWELGRHRHLVVLARAAWLQPENPGWAGALEQQLASWLDHNPPERGVHWYSNLEIALRAIAWVEILDLAGPQLSARLRLGLQRSLRHAARHLLADLPYTLSTMRNNHLLGDGLGLVVLGTRLDRSATARVGDELFAAQLARHVNEDGSMIEDSLSYHRFVLEMLERRVTEPGASRQTRAAMVASAQFLCRLGALEGPVPQYGDWDEGRVLVTTGEPQDVRGSALLALAAGGTGAPDEWREAFDEVAWHAPPGEPLQPLPAEVDGHEVGGGIARAARGDFTVWLKAGGGPSHRHADLCSVAIRHRGHWLVGDPGTGTYNGPLAQRTYFRSSLAHDVLRLGGADQLGPTRPFRWEHQATGVTGPPLRMGKAVILWGAHDAYRRPASHSTVTRVVVLDARSVLVADWVDAAGTPDGWALSLPLGPDVTWRNGALHLPDGAVLPVELPASATPHEGEDEPYDGWWSSTYGTAVPATRLALSGPATRIVWWRIGVGSGVQTGRTDAAGLAIDDLHLQLSWAGTTARLAARTAEGAEVSAYLRLP